MHICWSLTINNWRCWVMVMVGWRGTFVVSKVPNLLLLFLPPTPKSSEARRPQSLLSSWLCLAKPRLDFPGVRRDGNQGFEVSKTKVTGPEERCEQFACSSRDGELFWNIHEAGKAEVLRTARMVFVSFQTLAQNTYHRASARTQASCGRADTVRRVLLKMLDWFSASRNLGDVQEGAPVVTEIKHLLVWYAEDLLQKFLQQTHTNLNSKEHSLCFTPRNVPCT